MGKPFQIGCKKCGAVVTVDMKPWPDHADVKVKDGRVAEKFDKIEIYRKKCGKPVASLGLDIS